MRTGYDSTKMQLIPPDAQVVFGYPHAWPVDYDKFPHALQVRIDNHGDHADDCHVVDVEALAVPVGTVREWVESWHKLHPNGQAAVNGFFTKPTVYCSLAVLPSVRSALSGLDYFEWVAWWGVGPIFVAGTSLHQYANGEAYDTSIIYDATWGVHPQPPAGHPVTMLNGVVIPVSATSQQELSEARTATSTDGGHTWITH